MNNFNKWLGVGLACLLGFNVLLFGFYKIVVRGATNAVLEHFQKPYSPSPFGPGLDPDKLPPNTPQQPPQYQQVDFRTQWEAMRGAN